MQNTIKHIRAHARRVSRYALAVGMSLAVTGGLFLSSRSVSAFSGCQKVKGYEISAFSSPTTVSGTITQGGILNGTTQAVLASDFFPTPAPNTFSFNIDKTFITDKGVLQTHSPHIVDFASGIGTAFAYIDPNTSTGNFAGATGVLYVNFKPNDPANTSSRAEITGEICFAD